jgi:peptidyl-prolyl cis-trans isomerase C
MKRLTHTLTAAGIFFWFNLAPVLADASQLLVQVGPLQITAEDLEQAIASSPFATQFNTMDRPDQAALRGNLLKRLVISRLLRLEAEKLGLDKDEKFLSELEQYRTGLLYRRYMDQLRSRITIPEDIHAAMKAQFKGNPDGLTSAESAWKADRFRAVHLATLQSLRDQHELRIHFDRITTDIQADTVLAEGKNGFILRYSDVVDVEKYPETPNPEWIRDQLEKMLQLRLIVMAAIDSGINVDKEVDTYREERLPALLLEHKEKEWIPDDDALRAYFDAHPALGIIPERRHIGQLVVATRAEAEALRKRILAGESLYELAGKYSIDEYGRSRNGDMGWHKEGSGMPQIEQAIANLEDGEISPVIETPKGFHLVSILERRPGGTRAFAAVRDRVRRALLDEATADYVRLLESRYPTTWHVLKASPKG